MHQRVERRGGACFLRIIAMLRACRCVSRRPEALNRNAGAQGETR